MKKYLLNLRVVCVMLAFVLASTIANAQRTASASGPWNNTATWGGQSVPTSSDDVTINNGVTVTVNVAAQCKSITIGSTNTPGGITITGTNSLAVTNGVSVGDLLDNSSGITIAVGAGSFSCASLTMSDVTLSNDAITLSVSTGTATVTGSLTMNGASTENVVSLTNSGTLNIGDISLVNGGLSLSGTCTVNYTGATETVRPASYNNLILSGSGAKTVNGSSIAGTLSMQGTATATGTSVTYGIASTLEYKGSVAQTSSNAEFPSASGPRSLTINNSNGVTLHAARTINSTLTLTNGVLTTTSTNLLNLAINATATGYSDNSFVNGPLKKTGNIAFTFPVGVAGQGLRTIAISAPSSTTSAFQAEFHKSDPHGLTSNMGAGLVNISACEYWDLNSTGTASNVSVTLSWSPNSCNGASYVNTLSTLRVARLSAGTWVSEGNLSTTGSLSAGTVVSGAAVSNFNTQFVLATSALNNALPVMFDEVKGYQKNGGVQIEWSNLTERDLVTYIVEHSTNGANFSEVAQQAPRSNSNDKQSYASFDAAPAQGTNYYRVKVLEISGKVIYSKVVRVDIAKGGESFTLYPNPVKGNVVSVSINNVQGQYTLKVSTAGGQEILTKKINHPGGSMTQTLELPSNTTPGVYHIVISGGTYHDAKMFIVQ